MNPLAVSIATAVKYYGGRALLVGGCVRDEIMGITPKDVDLEIFGISEASMESLLSRVGSVSRVGRAFPVWKVWTSNQGEAIDVTLPRFETKVGESHTDFTITLDPHMTFEEASLRRDCTMNAIGKDPLTGEILDPHEGFTDIRRSEIRHVSHHFIEDPLRVLRIMQFAARFDMTVHPDTVALCSYLTPICLSRERLWEEWCKLILKGEKISRGLTFLVDCGWIKYYPELEAMIDVNQDPEHHPEGPVFDHCLHCMDAFAARRTGDEYEDLVIGFAALCHDMGKATTTTHDERGWHSYGHEGEGEKPTRAFLSRLTNEAPFIDDVVALVVNHMTPNQLYKEATRGETVKAMNRSVRRLSRKVRLDRLARLVLVDKSGRPPKPQVSPEADWLLVRSKELGVEKREPERLLQGRHLIDLGVKPGPDMGRLLNAALERQLDGEITSLDEALAFAKDYLSSPDPIIS